MFSYDQFKSKIKSSGLARQNRFYVNISPPPVPGITDISLISLMCQSVSLSGVNISTSPVRTTGETVEAAYDRTFSGASMVFYVDTDLNIRYFFDEWINAIQNPDSRVFSYPKEYKSPEIEIGVLRMDDSPSYVIKLFDAFPKTIGSLSMSGENNGVMTLDVSFDYKYYKSELRNSAPVRSPRNQQLVGADVQGNSEFTDVEPPTFI